MITSGEAIGVVDASRPPAEDDDRGGERARVTLTDAFGEDALQGIEAFSPAEILFLFHEVDPAKIVTGARHPRNKPDWPAVGIVAQRGKNRPNRIGSTVCRIPRRDGKTLHVAELDAIDGSPVLDITPVMAEFLPRETIVQPAWSHALMRHDWRRKT
jgi:tRNA (adenine37-N6)-methyltransferase